MLPLPNSHKDLPVGRLDASASVLQASLQCSSASVLQAGLQCSSASVLQASLQCSNDYCV